LTRGERSPVPWFSFYDLGCGCPGRQAPGGATGAEQWSPAESGCVGEENDGCGRLADRGPGAEADGGHELSKKKVNLYSDALAPVLPLLHNPGVALGLLTGPDHDPQSIGQASRAGSRGQGRGAKKREGWSDAFIVCRSFSISISQFPHFW
jgi:hypothetical protein